MDIWISYNYVLTCTICIFSLICLIQLERAVDGAPSQIPTVKFLTPTIKVPSLGHDPGDTMINPFDMFYNVFVRTHTKFGTKIFEIYFVIEI